jgi:hypothetical protein
LICGMLVFEDERLCYRIDNAMLLVTNEICYGKKTTSKRNYSGANNTV